MKRHPFAISIVTLTRDRASLLSLCLKSLVGQLGLTDEIVIVDNNSTDKTPAVIKKYKKILPIYSYRSKLQGYPRLYNFAIEKCTRDIVVFLDDDCVAAPDFIFQIQEAHHRYPRSIIQGMTYSIPQGNIYAEVMGDNYMNWVAVHKVGNNEMKIFDNKNASIPRNLLIQYGGFADELTEGSEDIELGRRLREHGIRIIFKPRIIAYHHERNTFKSFLIQHLRIARSERLVNRKLRDPAKIPLFNYQKTKLHLHSLYRRALVYIAQGRLRDFLLLPCLYILLFFVRIWGYLTAE